MFLGKKEDWKEYLDEETKELLSGLFDTVKKHRCAYCQADDVRAAQLWCVLVEMKKEFNKMKEMVETIKGPFKAIVEVGEIEKKRTIERLVRDLVKPEPGQEEATKKLVESLMKF